jgi:hypothetical protein
VLVGVPDKRSIYLGSLEEAKRKDLIIRRLAVGHDLTVVPLFEKFYVDARQVKDFYLPDDTHLSSVGQQYLGQEIRAAVHSLLSVSPEAQKP